MNDVLENMPNSFYGAAYADDIAIWFSEEYLFTANYIMQQALSTIENWADQWLVKVNPTKTKYTIFSLSTKELKANLKFNEQSLQKEDHPTYLGATLDKRLTWKPQIQKTEVQAKGRLGLMKKLAGTTWGANATTLKKLYTGRVRPVLEYSMAAWGTTAKTNFDRMSRVQNQALRIVTGGMKSSPIVDLETTCGIQSCEDRRDTKILNQAAKFKQLENDLMEKRMQRPTKVRLKRNSFIHQSRRLQKYHPEIVDQKPKVIPRGLSVLAWNRKTTLVIQSEIPHIQPNGSQNNIERKSITLEHLQTHYPI